MARVTVEDCILKVPSRFELVALAAQRARQIIAGADLTIERDNDKNPVIALREIANGNITPESLRESLIKKHQSHQSLEDVDKIETKESEAAQEMADLTEKEIDENTAKISNMYETEEEVAD